MQKLERLWLENYKAFNKRTEMKIRPLTLFFGYNSAGKSAALRFFQLLSDSTNGTGTAPLNLRSEVLRKGSFASLLSKHNVSSKMVVGIEFSDVTLEFSIRNLPDRKKQVIERLEIKAHSSPKPVVFEWAPEKVDADKVLQTYQCTHKDVTEVVDLEFDGLIPSKYPGHLRELLYPIAEALRAFGESLVSLSPDCIIPDRHEIEVAPARYISRRGEGLISMLQAAPQGVIEEISDWYESATGYSFQRKSIAIGGEPGHRFILHPGGDENIDIDIIDTGEGMGRVLPVVSLLTLARNGDFGANAIMSLEHPELHIHPDAHVHLAGLFCSAVNSDSKPRVLVETHSENLLLGIQLEIARGHLKPADVVVHWVRSADHGSVIDSFEFDSKARPIQNNWPIDVFRKNSKIARQLYEVRKAQGQ